MRRKSCAFTGHRPKKFPWKNNELDSRCVRLKEVLNAQIITMIEEQGVTDFLVGGAEGADTWAAQIILSLCEMKPFLRLHCVLPCREQADRWNALAQENYRIILSKADSVIYLHRAYCRGCMLERNRFMVDHADTVLAVYNGEQRGGTAATVRYAQKSGKYMIILDPATLSIKTDGVPNNL